MQAGAGELSAADLAPAVAEAVRRLPALLQMKIEQDGAVARAQIGAAGSAARWGLVVVALTVGMLLAVVAALVLQDRLSSDAAAVVIGTVAGGVFSLPRWLAVRSG